MQGKLISGVSGWHTQKGKNRTENRDAGGVALREDKLTAIIVDATATGPRGKEFAQTWVHTVLSLFDASESMVPEAIVSKMRSFHPKLRDTGFLAEVAAYAVLVVDTKSGAAWALNAGDCCVGGVTEAGEIRWFTPVHTCANPLGQKFTIDHANTSARHTLTRRLFVKRFDSPAVTHLDSLEVKSWILATDGFWVEHLLQGISLEELEDDASYILLSAPPAKIEQLSNSANFTTVMKKRNDQVT